MHGHVFKPGRYIGIESPTDDGEPFREKMVCFTTNDVCSGPRRIV